MFAILLIQNSVFFLSCGCISLAGAVDVVGALIKHQLFCFTWNLLLGKWYCNKTPYTLNNHHVAYCVSCIFSRVVYRHIPILALGECVIVLEYFGNFMFIYITICHEINCLTFALSFSANWVIRLLENVFLHCHFLLQTKICMNSDETVFTEPRRRKNLENFLWPVYIKNPFKCNVVKIFIVYEIEQFMISSHNKWNIFAF